MKFRYKLFVLISLTAISSITAITFMEFRTASRMVTEIDRTGNTILSEQAQVFLSKVLEDQAIKTRLKLNQASQAAYYAARLVSDNPSQWFQRHSIDMHTNLLPAADSDLFQLFLIMSDERELSKLQWSDSDEHSTALLQSRVSPRVAQLAAGKSFYQWYEIPNREHRHKLDVTAVSLMPLARSADWVSVLGVQLSISNLIHEYNQQQPIKGSYTILINDQGQLLAAPPNARTDLNPKLVFNDKGFIDIFQTNNERLKHVLVQAALGHISIDKIEVGGHLKFVVCHPVSGTNWRLIMLSPVSLATANVFKLSGLIKESTKRLMTMQFSIALVIAIISIAVAALLSKKITRPLVEMESATKRIAEGNLEYLLRPKGRDEIATLAHSFNAMTHALKKNIALLNQSKSDLASQLQVTTTLLETIPNPVYDKDAKGIITGCNHAFATFFNQPRETIIGRTFTDLLPESTANKDRQKDLELVAGGAKQAYEQILADGQNDQRTVIFNKATISSTDGQFEGLIGVITDITERMVAEKYLRLYERIVSTSSDLMSYINDQYIYLAVNDSYLQAHSKSADEIIGHSIPSLMGKDTFETTIKEQIDRCLNGEIIRYKSWFDYAGIGRRYMDVTYYPYQGEDGDAGLVVNARDITRTTQLEAQLQQASKMESIGTLAGGIAHDFNNILSSIIGYSDLLKARIHDRNAPDDYVDRILTASLRARDLVKQILMFSRQVEHEKRPIQADRIVSEALKLARSSLPVTIDIEKQIDPNCSPILADPTQIHQMAMNLITNAFHAMEATGGTLQVFMEEVKLELEELKDFSMSPGRYLCLTVTDTGHGIEQPNLSKIFDPYFTTKEKEKGTGLGLAVVHGVVKSCNGEIRIDSEVGKGTQVQVFIPVIEAEFEERTPKHEVALQGGNERILLVDDEMDIVELLSQFLEQLGYTVTGCIDSQDALKRFQAEPEQFDLLITDMTMPKMTGVELINQIRRESEQLKIILCSGFSEKVNQQKAKDLGVHKYVMKPVILSELANTIRSVLENR